MGHRKTSLPWHPCMVWYVCLYFYLYIYQKKINEMFAKYTSPVLMVWDCIQLLSMLQGLDKSMCQSVGFETFYQKGSKLLCQFCSSLVTTCSNTWVCLKILAPHYENCYIPFLLNHFQAICGACPKLPKNL